MYQFREQLIRLAKTYGQICLIYLKIAWAGLIRLKNLIAPRLKQFNLMSQQAAKIGWHATVRATKRFIHFCNVYSRVLGRASVKLAHKITQLLRRLDHFTLQLSKSIWRATVNATVIFIQICVISLKAFRRASVMLAHQIAQLLRRLGHFTQKLSLTIWHAIVNTTNKFIQLCTLSLTAFKRASVKFAQQIAYLLRRLGYFTLKLTIVVLHAFTNFYKWLGKLIAIFGRGCLVAIKKIGLAFTHFFQSLGNLLVKIILGFFNVTKSIFHAFVLVIQQISNLIESTAHYFWKKWLIVWERLYQYAKLVRLDKPIGIFLLLWPALWALWIAAEGTPDIIVLLIFILGVILMRSAGCAINDFVDRDIDTHVMRTQERPIASGTVTPREALEVAMLLIITAFILVLFLNSLTLKLSFVAVVLAFIYPFMKRITYLPQFFLGLAFAWSIPMAFAAQTNSVPIIAWLLLLAAVLWAVAYDTMYAMVDRDDDIRIGVRSTAILFDDADRFIIGCIQLLVLLALIMIGQRIDMSQYYYAGIAAAAIFSLYQQFLIKDRIPENCFRAFLNNNWFGATVFAGIFCHYEFY